MNDIQNILSHILIPNSGSKFYIFSNIDGKTWIMPHRNMSTAMNLYQPGGIKGKWMKCFFPFLKDVGLVRKKIGISVCNYELSSSLKTRLNSIFKTDNIEFSVFCGTPSAHQKITIQISHGNKILGYCKFSNKEEICSLFLHEQTILDALKEKQFKFIPECLYFGMLPDNIYLFVQSTLKTKWSKVLHQWTDLHWQFLYELKQKNRTKNTF